MGLVRAIECKVREDVSIIDRMYGWKEGITKYGVLGYYFERCILT